MRRLFFVVFFVVFLGSFLWAEISFHYVADLEFFYAERSASLEQALKQELGEQTEVLIIEGILGVQGVSLKQVQDVLERLRNEERHQVLWEFFLITALPCPEYQKAVFISVEEQKKILETLKEKKLISRALVPSRRGTLLKWISEKQQVQHLDQKIEKSSLAQAQIFFQGAEIDLKTNAGRENLQLEAQIQLNYFEGTEQKRYSFQGKEPPEARARKSSIWFVPFQQKTPCLYFMISAWPTPPPEFKKEPAWAPSSSAQTTSDFFKSYKNWEAPKQTGDHLQDLSELYQESAPEKKPPEVRFEKHLGFEGWEPLFLKEYPDTKIRSMNQWVQVEGDIQVHQLLFVAEQIHEKYSAEQMNLKTEHILLHPKHAFSVYQQVVPLITIPFSGEQRQNFFKMFQSLSWVRGQQAENRICVNRNQSWETTKQEISFLKGIVVDPSSSKMRTLADALSEGVATSVQAVLLESMQEYYLCYEYERNSFEKPCAEKELRCGDGLLLKIQEPTLYRERYQVKMLVPKGYSYCFWGLPLNLLSGEFQETLTLFQVQK